ncbi:uncharacterized protein LOC131319263 isoform X2 [Rhododendron vialii]|uniref:uncharacterized protein LOC131319263 isoform X2 n=1 Tax=Rhododendron vialii TaxID=182163 RepID=UPI00265F0EC4|nr:uncharacterized protein LOC131319263 isoform X2 [Rhododendron vialii]
MASSSNENSTSSQKEKYPYPTEYFNVLDFVPKLLSEGNYENWKLLMRDFIRMQGLIGFIEGADVEESNRDEAWNKSNNLVRGWILATLSEDIRLRVLSSESAKGLWMRLEEIFDATRSLIQQLDEETEYRQGHYLDLQKAAINGDWDKAKGVIEREPNAVRTPITPSLKTALTLAVTSGSAGRNHFMRELLEKMTPQDLKDLVDDWGKTALHHAAVVDNMEGAKMLVNKNPDLPNVLDNFGQTPLHDAAYYGHREMVLYMMGLTTDDILLEDHNVGALLLCVLIGTELYDIALTWLRRKPEIAIIACLEVTHSGAPFDILAEKHSSFQSGNLFNFWQSLIYLGVPLKLQGTANDHIDGGRRGDIENYIENLANCCISVRQRLHFMIWEVAEKLVPHVKRIRERKERQHHALELVKFLCKEVAKSSLSKVERIFKPTLRKAARVGIPEIIEEIVLSYPSAIYFTDLDNLNILKYAILYRRERVFNLIYQIGGGWRYMSGRDNLLNNCLHLAARLRHEQQINLKASVAGAALQMQREVQWFKEVEKFSQPGDKEKRNADGMTPIEVFSETHQDLAKEGERWMKDTATSCTIVAALIATMVFAAAVTVPGGNDDHNGQPILSKQKAFIIFGMSDALALFSSITSVLTFLLILTSRYAKEDFLYTLPKRLILGLITLYVSILSTMVAFGAILYLTFGDNKEWILIPIVASASIPVTLFGVLQFPLLVEMIQSTYGRGIFGKQSNRVLR